MQQYWGKWPLKQKVNIIMFVLLKLNYISYLIFNVNILVFGILKNTLYCTRLLNKYKGYGIHEPMPMDEFHTADSFLMHISEEMFIPLLADFQPVMLYFKFKSYFFFFFFVKKL